MNASPAPPRPIRWRWIFALLLLTGVVTWIGVASAPMIKREAAARELRRNGFRVGEGRNGPKEWWNALVATLNGRRVSPNPMSDRVSLTSTSVETLEPFASPLVRLQPKRIRLASCPRLRDASALKLLPQLASLEIHDCPNVTDLSFAGDFDNLAMLSLSRPAALKAIPPLKAGQKLLILSLLDCAELSNFDQLQQFKSLAYLTIAGSPGLQNAESLRGLTNLRTLVISDCPNLTDVTALHDLRGLKSLSLTRCPKLSIESLVQLRLALPGVVIATP